MAEDKIEDQEENNPDVEVETPTPVEDIPAELSAIDHLGNVVDAHITKDDDAASASFHDYLTQKVRTTLNPEPEEELDSDEPETTDLDTEVEEEEIS